MSKIQALWESDVKKDWAGKRDEKIHIAVILISDTKMLLKSYASFVSYLCVSSINFTVSCHQIYHYRQKAINTVIEI